MTTSNLRQLAMDATTLSHLMSGREKISTDELIKKYPDGFTLVACDWCPDENGEAYPVFHIEEEPTKFYSGGIVLSKVVTAWEESLGDLEAVNAILSSEGVQVKLETGKTKRNQNITKVIIL